MKTLFWTILVTLMSLGAGTAFAKPVAIKCKAGAKQVILTNQSGGKAWPRGAKVRWKTSHGERGKLVLRSVVKPGQSIKIGLNKPKPKSCSAKVQFP